MQFGLMDGYGETLQAIERTCDKRAKRGSTPDMVIWYLDSLCFRWKDNPTMLAGIDVLRRYWTARKG